MAASVPMSHPATAVKNSDGTYSVRIQHTTEGSVTTVDFTNVLFAETLATAYAAMLNGEAVVSAKVDQLITDAKPVIADATADIKKLLAEAEAEALKLVVAAKTEGKSLLAEAKTEAGKLKAEAQTFYDETKVEAEKLLGEARAEAAKLMHTAAAKVDPLPAPAAPVAKTVVEE